MSLPAMLNRGMGVLASMALLAGCASTVGAEAPKPALAADAPKTPIFTLADVEGKDAASLDAAFGAPALVRQEGEGQFRRYAMARCALIVILYPDEGGASVVRQIDAAALNSIDEKPEVEACLAGGLAPQPSS